MTDNTAMDKCPDPDCAYAQEAAALHVLVSRLESRLDSTRGELERTRERLREVERERDEWREEAWRCHVESGADPDGDDARHLNPGEAIRAVRELRSDYDAACDEAEQVRAKLERVQTNVKALYKQRNEAEAKLAQLKQSVDEEV